MKQKFLLILIAIIACAMPTAAQRQKVSDEERSQAIMRVYDLLESGRWVMTIENITTTKVSYSQLVESNNYILVADQLMTIQIDKAGANAQTNINVYERKEAERYAYLHPDLIDASNKPHRGFYNVVKAETQTNRRGTQVVHKLYLSTPDDPNSNTFSRLIVDPLTMKANFGIYSGHLKPADEAVLINTQPYRTEAQQRTINAAQGTYTKAKETVKFKIIAGGDYVYSINSLRTPEAIDDIINPRTMTFEVGVGLDLHVDHWAKGLTLQAALTYSPLHISDDTPIYLRATKPEGSGTLWQKKPWDCRGDLINLNLGGQYAFGTGRVRPLIRAGATVRYFVNNSIKSHIDFNGMYKVTDDRFYFNFNTGIQAGAYVGTGCLIDLGRHTLGIHADAALDRAGLTAEFAF